MSADEQINKNEKKYKKIKFGTIDEGNWFAESILTGSFIEKDPAIRNKGSVDIFSGSFNFQTVNP